MRIIEPLTDFPRQRTNSASSAQVETPQLELFSSQCSVAEPVENITGTPEATLHVSIAMDDCCYRFKVPPLTQLDTGTQPICRRPQCRRRDEPHCQSPYAPDRAAHSRETGWLTLASEQIAVPPLTEAGFGLGSSPPPLAWPGSLYPISIRSQPQCFRPKDAKSEHQPAAKESRLANNGHRLIDGNQALLSETEKLLESWKHPDPYVHPTAPGGMGLCILFPCDIFLTSCVGSKYERNLPSPVLTRK